MKTSRKTDYAIHSLMILARQNSEEISVKRLAKKQNISVTYLAKVMQKLASAGIVNSSEGKSGGYKMLKSAEDIKVAAIVRVMEGGGGIFDCVDDKRGCEIRDRCKIHKVLNDSYQRMLEELEKVSIKDVLDPELKRK